MDIRNTTINYKLQICKIKHSILKITVLDESDDDDFAGFPPRSILEKINDQVKLDLNLACQKAAALFTTEPHQPDLIVSSNKGEKFIPYFICVIHLHK